MDNINNLVKHFVEDGYEPINFDKLNTLKIYSLFKQVGSGGYFLNIVNCQVTEVDIFLEYKNAFLENIENRKDGKRIRNVIIYNVFAAQSEKQPYKDIIDKSEEFYNQDVYEINYYVDYNEKFIYLSDSQPHDFTNIVDIIKSSFEIDEGTNFEDENILKSAKKKTYVKKKTNKAFLTYGIMIINILLFILMELMGGSTNTDVLIKFGAMNMNLFLSGDFYRIITASFLHIGFSHIAFNTLSLYIFGTRIEKHYGHMQFLIIYLISSVVGNFANALFFDGIMAGASSGLFGLMGAALAITAVTKKSLEGLNAYIMLLFTATSFLMGLAIPNVGNMAHLFGLISGAVTGYLFARNYKEDYQ